ncbi:MAG: hypothetical protein RMJ36_05925 [Candidatus Calescibacterium sp.]|nr:hypothetical protein [Candidatus Calescibacterium sp.]MDW8133174.1 hypothetical protein [Candidatus Calescibacterium sp.]
MDKSIISNSIAIKNPGRETKVGSPFIIKNFQELKIIHQVFNPNSKINPENQIQKAAQLLSNFISKTFGAPYNWKSYDSENKTTLKEKLLKSLLKGIKFGIIIGAVFGLKILQIIGLITGISTLATVSKTTKELRIDNDKR